MPDAPEIVLNRALKDLIVAAGLADGTVDANGAIGEQGIRIDGVMPTAVKEFTLLTPLRPIPDGRAGMTYRAQIFTQRTGSLNTARQWAADLRAVLDQKEYTPAVLGIGWAWEFSTIDFGSDTQGRVSVASTYYFLGRRP